MILQLGLSCSCIPLTADARHPWEVAPARRRWILRCLDSPRRKRVLMDLDESHSLHRTVIRGIVSLARFPQDVITTASLKAERCGSITISDEVVKDKIASVAVVIASGTVWVLNRPTRIEILWNYLIR
jgi:hypothetical protein